MQIRQSSIAFRPRRSAAHTLLVTFCASFAFGQVRASTPPAAANIQPDDPASLQTGIEAVYKAGQKKVVVPPGIYSLGARGYALRFSQMHDFEIDATGVTLLRTEQTRGGIEFDRCQNVALVGMTLLNRTPPFTQAIIEAIDPAGKFFDLKICDGYPADLDNPRHFATSDLVGYVFDPKTRQWKSGTSDMGTNHIERLGPGQFRLYWYGGTKRGGDVSIGDEMAFRGIGGTDIHLGACDHMQLRDITIRNGGGFCIHESDGDGDNHYSNITVTYGPRPEGANEDPLIACNADAFHSSTMRRGPTLENCHFQGMPDDGVAIHGSFALAMESDASSLIVLFSGGNFFRPGDPLRWFDPKGQFMGEATVQEVAPAKDYQGHPIGKRPNFRDSHHYFRLTLDHALPAHLDDLVDDPHANGSGYVVRNCTIRNHRARGMLLKADDGLVENNTIDGSTMAGIVLSPEIWWNEAGFSRNVIIRGNTVRHVGYQNAGPWMTQAGAITVRGDGDDPKTVPSLSPEHLGHRNVVIEANTIENCDGLNLLVSSAADVRIRANHFLNPQQHPSSRGADHCDPAALIQIGACQDVTIAGNTVYNRGPYGRSLVIASDRPQVRQATDATTSNNP